MDSKAYLIGTTFEHCLSLYVSNVNLDSLPDANVFGVLKNGTYLLACINPQNKEVKVLLDNQHYTVDVRDVFKTIQSNCVAWCEL